MVPLLVSFRASHETSVYGTWGWNVHSGFILAPWLEDWTQLGHWDSRTSLSSYGLLTWFLQHSRPLFTWQLGAFKRTKVEARRPC